jgi:hypothetical protein
MTADGREWLVAQPLPEVAPERHIAQLDQECARMGAAGRAAGR